MTHNDLEHLRYEARLKAQRDESSLKTVSFQEGKAVGMEEGKTVGLIEGEQIGIQKGILEGEKIGIRKGIELALELKFGPDALTIIPRIQQIEAIEKLRQLQTALRSPISLSDFEKMLS
jgi:hypothetical protein